MNKKNSLHYVKGFKISGVSISDLYFEILGVTRLSTNKEIKKAYREKIKQCHPDKFANNINKVIEVTAKAQELNEAYSFLKNYNLPNEKYPNSKDSVKNISRIRVKSSNVFAIGYDINSKTLQVEFKKGHTIYEYYDVPSYIYEAFMRAESKGGFMSNLGKYKYRKVYD